MVMGEVRVEKLEAGLDRPLGRDRIVMEDYGYDDPYSTDGAS